MPSLTSHQSNDFTKLLAIGDPKSGKTGSLVSLVKAGFKLRIMDFDNLLDILAYMIQRECPDKAGNVEFVSLRDKYKGGATGTVLDGSPTAWKTALKLMDKWEDGTSPDEWGPDTILVIDSLSRLCDAAFNFHESINKNPDERSTYFAAQDGVEKFLAQITSPRLKTNLIVIAHIVYQSQPDGTTKGYPQGVGQKLSPKIPQYFPSVVLYTNKNGKRMMRTNSSPLIDLSNPKPFEMQPEYPIETGLAQFFEVLRAPPKQIETKGGPKLINARR